MRIENSVIKPIDVKWDNITLPLRAGTPIDIGGNISNNRDAIGLVMQNVREKPVSTSKLYVLIGGGVTLSEVQKEAGVELTMEAMASMSGINFYLDDGTIVEAYTENVPPATETKAGVVKVGSGLSVTSDGTLSVDPELLEEDVTGAVNGWLDDHPEATTTVEDGSITKAKLAGDVVDADLETSGAAADAKKTGDEISGLKDALSKFTETDAQYDSSANTDGKYLNSSGVEQEQSGWSVTDYLQIGVYALYYIEHSVTSNNVKSCFYDADKQFVSAFKTDTSGLNELDAPTNAKYVRFSIQTADTSDFIYQSKILLDNVVEVIKPYHLYRNALAKTFKDEIILGEYFSSGAISSNANWSRTKLYPVSAGDLIHVVNAYGEYIDFFDANGEYTGNKTTTGIDNVTFVVEDGIAFIGVNVRKAEIASFECYVNGMPLGANYAFDWIKEKESIWYKKTYISHGDSITWQDGETWGSGPEQGQIAKGYQTIFADNVKLGIRNNQGKSGWSMAIVNGNGVVNTVLSVSDYTIYDLCTIACGTNDFKLNVPLGTLGEIGDTVFDDSTFYGAFRKSVEYILTSSPTIRLVLMTPLQRDNAGYDVNYVNSAGHKLIDYVNAVKAIGQMYGLPVCDMYSNSGFTEKTLSTYTLDGLHPNSDGYVRMGDYLTGFLETVGN